MRYGWLVVLALLAWVSVPLLLNRWWGHRPCRGVLFGAAGLGVCCAAAVVLVGTSRRFDDLASGHEPVAALVWGALHLAATVAVGRRHGLLRAVAFAVAALWVEAATAVVLLAGVSLLQFGYIP